MNKSVLFSSHAFIYEFLDCIVMLENNIIERFYHLTTYSNAGQVAMVPRMHHMYSSHAFILK